MMVFSICPDISRLNNIYQIEKEIIIYYLLSSICENESEFYMTYKKLVSNILSV